MSEQSGAGPLLAWQFDLGERRDGVQVVFAASEARATIYAGRQSGGGKGDRTPVVRVACFDKYVTAGSRPGGNPDPADFWEEGYEVTCSECEHKVGTDPCWRCVENVVAGLAEDRNGDEQIDEDAVADRLGCPVTSGGHVYCSQRCLDTETRRHVRRTARKDEARAALAAKYPFVRVLGASVGGVGECQGRPEDGCHEPHPRDARSKPRKKTCYDVDPDNVTVRFKVPGGALSETTSDGNAYHNVYCHRCGHLWIAKGDYDAFECQTVVPDAVVTPAAPNG